MKPLVKNIHDIRLGVIGMTPGNGHPYSWSAIINGFDSKLMNRDCQHDGFRIYLNKVSKSQIGIPGVKVTHVACDGIDNAAHIAAISRIPNVLAKPEELIGKVDAVLIATDIGDEHVKRAHPFIEASIPVFIDKPLCCNLKDLQYFQAVDAAGALFLSSSSMRYAKELIPYHLNTSEIGQLLLVNIAMCKSLEAYGIHALEAVYPLVGPGFISVRNIGGVNRDILLLRHSSGPEFIISCFYDMAFGTPVQLLGTAGSLNLTYADSFSAFKAQLEAFVSYLRTGKRPFQFAETVELMQLLAAAIESRKKGGIEINMNDFKQE